MYRGRIYGNNVMVLCNRLCWFRTETKTGFSCSHNRSNASLRNVVRGNAITVLVEFVTKFSGENGLATRRPALLLTCKFMHLYMSLFSFAL